MYISAWMSQHHHTGQHRHVEVNTVMVAFSINILLDVETEL